MTDESDRDDETAGLAIQSTLETPSERLTLDAGDLAAFLFEEESA